MKLFSIRNLLGIGAVYGGWKYAQKHGGVKQAFNGLLDKVKTAAEQRDLGSPGVGSSLGSEVGSSEIGSSISGGYGSSGTSGSYGGGYSGGVGGGGSGNTQG